MILKNVSYQYKEGKNILNHVDFQFDEGVKYLIQGENGSGKTTLIRLILGFDKPTAGSIIRKENTVFSYCPDHNGIYNDLSVIDNIIFRMAIYKQDYKEYKEYIDSLLEKLNMLNSKEKKVSELSQGMKKKTALICSVVVDANYLLLDEPTNGVDEKSKAEIIKMLNAIADKKECIICISHDKDLARDFSGVLLKMEKGTLNECI